MQNIINRVERAIADLKQGKMIILTDSPERENEGDLIVAAEKVTSENMNFMIRNGSGIVCIAMSEPLLNKLELQLMVPTDLNSSYRGTPFSVSVDAKEGITTGVSSLDRAQTVLAMIDDNASPDDLVKPGHMFPLQAKPGGVLQRQGHTEGSVDLARLAGFKEAAVLCEIMNPDGTMTHGKQLDEFAEKHNLTMITIDELVLYRFAKENMVETETSAELPTDSFGDLKIRAIREKFTGIEHLIISKGDIAALKNPLIRIHSSCTTGDIFSSLRCDCHEQLQYSLKRISEEGGILFYLNQEGRGIGLFNKIKAYELQQNGYDTVEANIELGLPADDRKYYIVGNILLNHQIKRVRLLTNNPDKIQQLSSLGIEIEREAMPLFKNAHNEKYLKTKQEKFNHLLNL